MNILTLLLLILILGIIIFVHELGHFFWAKKFGVHIYEFSLGMGPLIKSFKGKDGIPYNIRAIPIGGFVAMAGEVYEDDDLEKIPKEKFMCNKPWYQRVIILAAGVINNFILAIVLLFVMALIYGGNTATTVVDGVVEGYPMSEVDIQKGDKILAINGKKVSNWDTAQIRLYMKSKNEYTTFTVLKTDGKKVDINVKPKLEKIEGTNEEMKVYGMQLKTDTTDGVLSSLKYAFVKFWTVLESMALTIGGLITGKISIGSLSGPVGMYKVVGQSINVGLNYIIYLIAFLSINVGFINILPFPAFDGGRIFFLLIEKIKGSPVNSKFENICHLVGFVLLIILMIFITIQDIIKIF